MTSLNTAADAVATSGLLESLMASELADRITADEEAGRGRWIWDPNVDGVVAFQVTSEVGGLVIVVILYLEHEDFENNDSYASGEWLYGAELVTS